MSIRKSISYFTEIFCFLIIFIGCKQKTDYYTSGVGIYPGNQAEDFSPSFVVDKGNYRNLAKLRPAYHSSSYDYNLTAQLTTDGIITDEMPATIALSTNHGLLFKNEREWLLDQNSVTAYNIDGSDIWIQIDMKGGEVIPEITRIHLNGNFNFNYKKPGDWQFVCSGSNDGIEWNELGKIRGSGLPGKEMPNPFHK